MSHESDADRTVAVSDDDVRVEKSFARDEFPVPAITFRLTSESDEPVHIRLVDRIPEEFPMEGIGFHPDYESDNWTAYKDHRVEYDRTMEPGEAVTTVYGIRLEEASDVAGFLREPILERPPVPSESPEERPGSDVDDILGTDRSQLVRDALQGRGRLVEQTASEGSHAGAPPEADEPAVEPAPAGDAAAAGAGAPVETDPDTGSGADDAPEDATAEDHDGATAAGAAADAPRSVESGLTPAVGRNDDAVTPVAAATDDADPDATDEEPASDADPDAADGADVEPEPASEADAASTDAEADPDAYVDIGAQAGGDVDAPEATNDGGETAGRATDDGLTAALAAEIRAGEVSESDLETLRGELDGGLPRSADVRIRRLQSQLADLDAYADAIREFIDEEGTGAELVERLDAELDAVTAEVEALREGIDAAEADRETLRGDVEELSGDLAATDERVDDVDATAETAVSGVEELHERADGIAGRLDDVEVGLDDLADDIGDVDTAIEGVAADVDAVATDLDETDTDVSELDDEVAAVREDVAAVDAEVEGVREELTAAVDDLGAEVSALSDELDRVESIEAEIEQLQAFRDRLNSAFGPGGGTGGGGGGGGGADTGGGGE